MPYRDDRAALEARRAELQKELEDATRKAEALADAEAEKARLARELAAVEAKIARSGARRLPLLERVSIASPCHASWDDMVGDDRVRFCGSCEKNVYNLSAMASAEAEALLREHEGNACVRLYRRRDGTVLTADCPVGVRRKRVRRVVAVAVATGAGSLAAFCSGFYMMGKPAATMGAMAPEAIGSAAPEAWTSVPMMGAPVAQPPRPEPTQKTDPPVKPAHPPRMGKPAVRP